MSLLNKKLQEDTKGFPSIEFIKRRGRWTTPKENSGLNIITYNGGRESEVEVDGEKVNLSLFISKYLDRVGDAQIIEGSNGHPLAAVVKNSIHIFFDIDSVEEEKLDKLYAAIFPACLSKVGEYLEENDPEKDIFVKKVMNSTVGSEEKVQKQIEDTQNDIDAQKETIDANAKVIEDLKERIESYEEEKSQVEDRLEDLPFFKSMIVEMAEEKSGEIRYDLDRRENQGEEYAVQMERYENNLERLQKRFEELQGAENLREDNLADQLDKIRALVPERFSEVRIVDNFLLAKTNEIVVEHKDRSYNFGKFDIQIRLDNLKISFATAGGNQRANGYYHPHIENNNPCWGNLSEAIETLSAERSVLLLLLSALELISHYNPGNPFTKIENFERY